MARRRKHSKGESGAEMEMDMTPMIDCVFLLIIFFMIVAEFEKLETVTLELPTAHQAVKQDAKKPIVINVTWDPKEKKGKYVINRMEYTLDELDVFLETEVMVQDKWSDFNGMRISEVPVTIRGDIHLHFRYIQDIIAKCMKHKIYKLEFAARQAKGS